MLIKQKIKYIQSLGQKKFRDWEKCFVAEGPKLVKDLLAADPGALKELYATPGWLEENEDWVPQEKMQLITRVELEKISQLTTPNQVLAVINQYETGDEIELENKLTLVLDTIQDPGNFGTILRIADWFGLTQVVAGNQSADLYNNKVVQASMGSIARIKVYYRDLAEWLSHVKHPRIYATALEGKDIRSMDTISEGILLIGNESKGISEDLLSLAHEKITIRRKGRAESLNAAVATGIVLSYLTP
jgi:TrmH family RNA methyltransferase